MLVYCSFFAMQFFYTLLLSFLSFVCLLLAREGVSLIKFTEGSSTICIHLILVKLLKIRKIRRGFLLPKLLKQTSLHHMIKRFKLPPNQSYSSLLLDPIPTTKSRPREPTLKKVNNHKLNLHRKYLSFSCFYCEWIAYGINWCCDQ